MSSNNRGKTHPASIPAVILAAGKGTRMRAHEPKAAVRVGGRPMVARVADAMRGAGIARIIAVVGHRAADVRAAVGGGVEFVIQEEQLGTGHAAQCARAALTEYEGPVVIAYADIPLMTEDDISRLLEHHILSRSAATLLTAILPNPGALGRIVRAEDGSVLGIVEARDASEDELKIQEINVGAYCFDAPLIFDVLTGLRRDNAQSQYYLTDAIGMLVERGARVSAIALQLPHNGMGVDTIEDLARAQQLSTGGGGA